MSVLTVVKFELVAMMVLALPFAVTELECGLAPLEHGLLCGLARAWPSPVRCDACLAVCRVCGCGDGFWNPRCRGLCLRGCYGGSEGLLLLGGLSGIFKVSEWEAAAMMLSVGCMFMKSGDFPEFPFSCMFCEDAENMRSSCDCGYFVGEDSCSQDCSNVALNLLAVFACVYRFQPFIGVMLCPSLLCCLPCVWPVPFRDAKEHASKVWGKITKVKRNSNVSRPERLKPGPRL